MNNELNQITNSLETAKIIEILNSNLNTANVFNKYGIEYYSASEMRLDDAARESGIPLANIIRELKTILNDGKDNQNPFNMEPVELSKWIVEVHHSYTKESIKEIINYVHEHLLEEFSEAFKNLHTQLTALETELLSHMEREERILFPLIKYLVETEKFNERPKTRNYGTIRNPVQQMLNEHDSSVTLLKKIAALIDNLPERKNFQYLKEHLKNKITSFRYDLYKHIHLENNLLFPRTIQLENKLLNKL